MEIITNEKMNFNSLEEKIYKDVMKLGRETIQEQLSLISIKFCSKLNSVEI